jgi:nitrite reductase/ring-hydroxylating ferredoxin subunit
MKRLIATLREEELSPGRPARVTFSHQGRSHSVLALRRRGVVYAWLNLCPHWGIPLGDDPAALYSRGARELRCGTHDARFRLEDGVCTGGPCLGDGLEPVPVCVALGRVFFYLPGSMRGEKTETQPPIDTDEHGWGAGDAPGSGAA